MEIANGSLEIFAAMVIFILFVSMRGGKSKNTIKKCLTSMVICHMMVLLLDATRWLLYQRDDLQILLIVLSIVPTFLALIGNAIFVYFVVAFLSQRGPIPRKTIIPMVLLFAFALLTWSVFILLNGMQSAANMQTNYETMRYSWGYWIGHFCWALVCAIGLVLIWRCRHGLNRKELMSLFSYCIFPLFALILRLFWDGAQIFLSTSLSLIWIYAVVQREQQELLQEQENQLIHNRVAILFSQIHPHFLYNTLTAICGLCDEDPKEAKKATAEFADYLRHNLKSITQYEPVSFADELAHTKVYLSIEKRRFENNLIIVYNIAAENFFIPALTVQPLTENAVKHGVCKAKNGGTVTIATAENADYYLITIADNGIGFDSSKLQHKDNIHIGIQNVRERLWSMCRGTLAIKSDVGKGTTAIIAIPKGELKK